MDDDAAMGLALELAADALRTGDVPVGAVVVRDGVVLGRGCNRVEADRDPTAHAEMLALRQASAVAGGRLEGATLVATLEPCPMCAGAAVLARVARVVYGCDDPKGGAIRSLYTMVSDPRRNHQCKVRAGVRADAAAGLLDSFFRRLRGTER
jgi:tRNA(adenine34) deaminase